MQLAGYQESNRLDAVFAALADPTRRALLARLSEGSATVKELAAPLHMSQPAVSKHLKVLEGAGLVNVAKDGTSRPRSLDAAPLADASAWLERYREYWETSFERLDGVLDQLRKRRSN